MSTYLINLTTFGSPFIVKHFAKKDDDMTEAIQSCVSGYFEKIDRKTFRINPMFMKNDKRWELVNRLLLRSSTQVYVNENGIEECCTNAATMLVKRHPSGCPHLMGDVCIKVSENDMKKANINPDCLTLIREEDEFDYEDEEDEDYIKIKKECDENGWEFYASAGQIFKCKA